MRECEKYLCEWRWYLCYLYEDEYKDSFIVLRECGDRYIIVKRKIVLNVDGIF